MTAETPGTLSAELDRIEREAAEIRGLAGLWFRWRLRRVRRRVARERDDRIRRYFSARPSDTVPAPPPRQPDRALRGYIEQANQGATDG